MERYPSKGAVIVTGAAQGIGRRLALMLVEEGVNVCIADWNEEKGMSVASETTPGSGKRIFVKTDVSDEADCTNAVARTIEAFGGVFGLVNNASIFSTIVMRPFWEIPSDEWDRVMEINLKSIFNMTRAAREALVESGQGAIVNISSSTIHSGRPNYAHYVSSKAGVMGFTRAMARELGDFGVRANTVTPGPTFTEVERATVTPEQKEQLVASQCIKRAAGPDDIADVIMFLLSQQSRWMTGQMLNVDGGINTY